MRYKFKLAITGIWLVCAVVGAANAAAPPCSNSDAAYNTACGTDALFSNMTNGVAPVYLNTPGAGNTATGFDALYSNTTAYYSTASGAFSLYSNTTGNLNTASGSFSMYLNTTGSGNTASGYDALGANTTGGYNSAFGYEALQANTTGGNNTAFGRQVLAANTTGFGNAGQGFNALTSNTTGYRNTAIGNDALQLNVAGIYNTALGFQAGVNITGSHNIDIGNAGSPGDSNTIRIGATTQVPGDSANNVIAATYIAGINGVQVSGMPVYVSASGQLGIGQPSSERFKRDVATMPKLSERLAKLRPVTFRYQADRAGTLQYGLIAEEVDKVYPELVIRDDQGKIQGVHYEELAPILLREVQSEQQTVASLVAEQRSAAAQILAQAQQLSTQAGEISALKAQLAELAAQRGSVTGR